MTEKEIGILLTKMHTYFPAGNSKRTAKEARNELVAWYELFRDFPAEALNAALNEYTMTNDTPFAPSPGQLHAIINKNVVTPNLPMDKFSAWDTVVEVMQSSDMHYEPQKAFDSLPETIQKAVGNARTLRQWSLMNVDRLEFIKTNFYSRYQEIAEAEGDKLKLPSSTLEMLSQTGAYALNTPEEK